MYSSRAIVGSLVFAVAMLVVAARDAHACSCLPSGPPCEAYFRVDAVFAGTVQAITRPKPTTPPRGLLRVEFANLTVYRGAPGDAIAAFTADSGAACGFAFRQGQRYLVYAHRTPDGRLQVYTCSRTRPIDEADEDVRFAQALSTAAPVSRVFGSIEHWERDLANGGTPSRGPLAGVMVTLRGTGVSVETRTSADGMFEFKGLAPGRYQVHAVAPPLFSTDYLERTVDLRDPRACAQTDFGLQYDGRISGTLLTSTGVPAEGRTMEAVAAERVGARYADALHATVDASGHFEFRQVPPGRYVIGVNLRHRANTNVAATYHPGTPEASNATVVEMGNGERRTLAPMTLPPR